MILPFLLSGKIRSKYILNSKSTHKIPIATSVTIKKKTQKSKIKSRIKNLLYNTTLKYYSTIPLYNALQFSKILLYNTTLQYYSTILGGRKLNLNSET